MTRRIFSFMGMATLLLGGLLPAQLPLVRGSSSASSGMLVYDVNEADDMKARSYLYSLCPRDAKCASLDFTLLEGNGGVDFIRVFDGPDRDAPLLGTLGAKSGSMLLQASSGCITFEFTRAESGLRSAWTALWRGRSETDCIDPERDRKTGLVQDVCGPEYRENRHLWRNPPPGSYLPSAFTYRFLVAKDGMLNFQILPDNGRDNYDWELYAYLPSENDSAAMAELTNSLAPKPPRKVVLARNFASGAGSGGCTGMVAGTMGANFRHARYNATTNPYFSEMHFAKGEELFLAVYPGDLQCHGFRLLLNETVLQCDQPVGELIRVAHQVEVEDPVVPARNMFSRSTQVWRLDLSSKANSGLAESVVMPGDWEELAGGIDHFGRTPGVPETRGLAGALLLGLKSGMLEACAAHDFSTPIHYGDLMDLSTRMMGGPDSISELQAILAPRQDFWWNPSEEQLSGFRNMVELIVDEVFDKNSGTSRVQVRYVRLIWSDWEGVLPDYNVAVFRYSDLVPILSRIRVRDHRNEARSIRMTDVLEARQFEYVTTWKSGKSVGSPARGQYLRERGQELENYHWWE